MSDGRLKFEGIYLFSKEWITKAELEGDGFMMKTLSDSDLADMVIHILKHCIHEEVLGLHLKQIMEEASKA